jgi:hypothetical protein
MCFAESTDKEGRVHSAVFFEGKDGEEAEVALSRWDEVNPDKQRIAWIPRKRANKYYFVVEFILNKEVN